MAFAFDTCKLAAIPVLFTLAACGGGGGDSSSGGGSTTPAAAAFKSDPVTWTFALPATGSSVCYDFDAAKEAACDGTSVWDIKITSGARGTSLWTNSGVTNSAGNGGAFGFFDWSDLQKWTNATTEPSSKTDVSSLYTPDSASSIFTSKSWYAYDLEGTHKLYPNYRVYVAAANPASTADPTATAGTQWAAQIIGYYGGSSGTTGGYPKLRWIDRANPSDVRTATIDASSTTQWKYFNLSSGSLVDLADADAATSTAWHIAFRRYDIKLNGGTSGAGTIAGTLGKELDGFYDASGQPVKDKFLAATPDNTLSALTDNSFTTPSSSSGWTKDSLTSVLAPAYTGSYPNPLDFGFYVYYPTGSSAAGVGANEIAANAGRGVLLRSGSGDSYARVHLTKVQYADVSNASSQQTWTFEFNVQPASK